MIITVAGTATSKAQPWNPLKPAPRVTYGLIELVIWVIGQSAMMQYSSQAIVKGGAPPVITEKRLIIAVKTARCVHFEYGHIGLKNHKQS